MRDLKIENSVEVGLPVAIKIDEEFPIRWEEIISDAFDDLRIRFPDVDFGVAFVDFGCCVHELFQKHIRCSLALDHNATVGAFYSVRGSLDEKKFREDVTLAANKVLREFVVENV